MDHRCASEVPTPTRGPLRDHFHNRPVHEQTEDREEQAPLDRRLDALDRCQVRGDLPTRPERLPVGE